MPRSTMILAMAACAALGCGGAASTPIDTRTDTRTVDLAPRPPVDAQYEILHRETRGVEGETPVVIETRTLLRVLEVRPDGSRRIRARLYRSDEDTEEGEARLADQLFDIDLSPTGELVGVPERQCEDLDTLRVDRYLRHLFAARAFVADGVGEGSEWRADYLSDATELATRAAFHVDELDAGEVRGRVRSNVSLEEGDFGAYRVTGDGRVRGRFTVAIDDGFSGRTDLQTTVRGEIVDRESGQRRRGTFRTRSQILVRPADADDPPIPERLVLDPQTVVNHIHRNLPAIQSCYEERLRENPTLAGRVAVRFTIFADGHVRDVRVMETTAADPSLPDCITQQVRNFRFPIGPACGSVSFQYPFVFAPQH